MTLEEACRLIDPATDLDALAEIEYYNGFKGKDAAAKALHEASQMVVDFVRPNRFGVFCAIAPKGMLAQMENGTAKALIS